MPSDFQPSRDRQLVTLLFVVSLSLALPALVMIGSVYAAFSHWPLGLVMIEQHRFTAGTVQNGELWHPVTKYMRETYSPPCESRIVRLDLETGVCRETELKLPTGTGSNRLRLYEEFDLIWKNDQLHVVDRFATVPTVWRVEEGRLSRVTDLPVNASAGQLFHAPFFHEGRLTVVEQIRDGEFRFLHFVDGSWVQGQRIRLPIENSRWVHDSEGPRIRSETDFLRNRVQCYLTVASANNDFLIRFVITDNKNEVVFAAYRNGFEYINDVDVASALSLANVETETAGWEQVHSSETSAVCSGAVVHEQKGVVLGIRENHQYRFVRRESDGQWKLLSGLEPPTRGRDYDTLITGPSGHSYVCRSSSEWWDRVTFYPINGSQVLPAQLTLPGHEQSYVDRWRRFACGLLLAWIVHVLVLIGGQQLYHRQTDDYEFGTQKSLLAPAWLRGVAFLIDVMVFSLLIAISFAIHWHYLGIEWHRAAAEKLSELLCHIEMNMDSVINVVDCIFDPQDFIGRPSDSKQLLNLFLTVFIDTFLPLGFYLAHNEGRTGATLGKWLTGLRTVRSTLRPCGLARAVVRSTMYLIDIPLLITPLPATISMILSPHCQRLGDRVADTLVIKSK